MAINEIILNAVAAGSVAPVTKTDVGWTYTTTIQLISLVIGAPIGGGLLWTTAKGVSLLWQKSLDSRKQDTDAATVVRREMMEFNEKLQLRIDGLENAGREDRRKFDEEMSNLRKAHAEEVTQVRNGYEAEIRNLREEITGLRRQMAQWQRSSGTAAELAQRAPTAAMKQVEDSGLGEILRGLDVPNDDIG